MAAVELGRSCASLASGGRNAEADSKLLDLSDLFSEEVTGWFRDTHLHFLSQFV